MEDVVNPTNVGAIFRSAAALHMDAVLLTRGCSDPLYRRAARVSMGTVFQIPWTKVPKQLSWPEEGLELLKKVLLTRGCSDPLYRRAARVSMGTVFQIPWTKVPKQLSWPEEGLELLKKLGFRTAAMALCEESVSIDDERLKREEKLAVILGTEGDGLAGKTIADCDYTVKIPMSHGVDSLNVAAASAVAFWQLGRREN